MVTEGKTSIRVGVYIDNSNVYRHLRDLTKINSTWPKLYNPYVLGERLSGGRALEFINFYCAPPPSHLQVNGPSGARKYSTQMAYYEAVSKLPKVELKYATLAGTGDSLREKNLDTQLTADMIRAAIEGRYDTCILVSNDGDYQSAVEMVKDLGKGVELLYFKGSVSMALRRVSDVMRRARPSYFAKLDFPY
ncbi:NYN domain-containing protein [Patescibacteria group bacterium]|nr:NYN domain-containing protein [Patescibacteria group bacterium]